MAEYDAFGRRKGEDPLEQLGSPEPAPAATPPARTGRRIHPVGALIAAAGVVVALGLGPVIALFTETAAQVESAPAPTSEAGGLEPGSLLTRPVLARVVDAMRARELGRPVNIRLTAERIDAQLATRRSLRFVEAGPDGILREQRTVDVANLPTMPWSAVDPAAPQRLIRAAAEREGRSAADVDYLVLMPLGDPTWGLFFKGGTHYQGDAAGKILRRVSP